MDGFWDSNVWGVINIVSVLLISILLANTLKRIIPFLRESLIPTSVLGGIFLLIISTVYELITDELFFNLGFFNGNGVNYLEMITYHALALGFIATAFKPSKRKFDKERTAEIFNTGVTTVATYLIQGIVGLAITMIAGLIMTDFFSASGILLPFGFGQGTGQALNYGGIYESDYGFIQGKDFGLSIAALGFLSASIGGIIHMNILKKKGKIKIVHKDESAECFSPDEIQNKDEIPMTGSVDKLSVQLGFVIGTYVLVYAVMYLLGLLLPGMKATIYGFNFLFGVLIATLISVIHNFLRKKRVLKKQYVNEFLMKRISGFFFDIMVVAGIAAIRLEALERYWHILLILGIFGLLVTYFYNYFVAKKLFPDYTQEQFLAMYGMLTGTASTGIILLREIDMHFESPASDNLVYQNLPAILFGFPLMLLATIAPQNPLMVFFIMIVFFIVLNIILFRSFIFKRRKKQK